MPWSPETIDWYDYFMNIHFPALQKWVLPELDETYAPKPKSVYAYRDLLELFDTTTKLHKTRVAMRMERGGRQESYSYRDLRELAERAGTFLVGQGVKPGDRVILFAKNSPEWPMCYFGILKAGAHRGAGGARLDGGRGGEHRAGLGRRRHHAGRGPAGRSRPSLARDAGAGGTADQAVALRRGVRARSTRRSENERKKALVSQAAGRHRGLAHLHLGHHRQSQGRDAHPPQPDLHGGRAVAHLRPGHLRLHDVGAAAAPHASSSPPACSCRWRTARASPTSPT